MVLSSTGFSLCGFDFRRNQQEAKISGASSLLELNPHRLKSLCGNWKSSSSAAKAELILHALRHG